MVCSHVEGRCDGRCERTGYREVAFENSTRSSTVSFGSLTID